MTIQHNNPIAKTQTVEVFRSRCIGSRTAMIHAVQAERGEEPCFRTAKRLLCTHDACEWRIECRSLVAVWKR